MNFKPLQNSPHSLVSVRGTKGDGKRMEDKYRINHKRPSVAVFFFSVFSPSTKSSKVELPAGFDSYRSRIFCKILDLLLQRLTQTREVVRDLTFTFPFISFLTTENAALPRRSVHLE